MNTPRLPNFILKDTLQKSVKSSGYRDYNNGGIWVEGTETLVNFQGGVFPLSDDDIKYYEAGTYKETDRKLYCEIPLLEGQEIIYESKRYTVHRSQDNTNYSTFYRYVIRRVDDTSD